jgi:hypothetical protein
MKSRQAEVRAKQWCRSKAGAARAEGEVVFDGSHCGDDVGQGEHGLLAYALMHQGAGRQHACKQADGSTGVRRWQQGARR